MRGSGGTGALTCWGCCRRQRKTSWQLAEFAGDASPDRLQRLLNASPWDEDACRDALCRYVIREPGHPAAVLAPDETGFLKKRRMSAGVARQYTGTAGQVENCQAGVFLAYCPPDGSRELYLPAKWMDDRERFRAAGIGDDVPFATRPRLARQMLARAVKAGVSTAIGKWLWLNCRDRVSRRAGCACGAGRVWLVRTFVF